MTDSVANVVDLTRMTRQQRAALPLSTEVAQVIAEQHGVCIRPLAMRRIDTTTGRIDIVPVPCGSTRQDQCRPCADKARRLRTAQCREGWHLDTEPIIARTTPSAEQQELMAARADLLLAYAQCRAVGDQDSCEQIADTVAELDDQLRALGVRGRLAPLDPAPKPVKRSTRRRQDAPNLPRRPIERRTLGKVFAGRYRPSTFVTLTLDSYGKVDATGAAIDPDTYDYRRAARDAIHFPALVDRFWQNTRRCVGWDVQYFGTVEPQKRGAPHFHTALRGTIPRAELRAITAATYHQVWWPPHDQLVYTEDRPPVWDTRANAFTDPDTGVRLPTFEQACQELTEPTHVVRFGPQVHVKGILGGTEEAGRHIGYLLVTWNHASGWSSARLRYHELRVLLGVPMELEEKWPVLGRHAWAVEWLRIWADLGRAPRTIDAYARGLAEFLQACERDGVAPLVANRAQIARFVRELTSRPGGRGGNVVALDSGAGLANATLQQRLVAVRLFYDFLIEEGLRESNPVGRGRYTAARAAGGQARALVPRMVKLPWIPAEQQWLDLLAVFRVEPVRNRLMLALAYDAALRREELCSLRTDDVDPAHRMLRVRAETTKTRRERMVPYSAATGVLLSAYLAHRATISRARGPLFLSESRRNHAEPLTLWTWSKVVRRAALVADVPRFSTHTTRHLCLTDLARMGWELHAIATFAGHASTDSTLRYIHLSGRELSDKLNRGMAQIHAWRVAMLTELGDDVPSGARG